MHINIFLEAHSLTNLINFTCVDIALLTYVMTFQAHHKNQNSAFNAHINTIQIALNLSHNKFSNDISSR